MKLRWGNEKYRKFLFTFWKKKAFEANLYFPSLWSLLGGEGESGVTGVFMKVFQLFLEEIFKIMFKFLRWLLLKAFQDVRNMSLIQEDHQSHQQFTNECSFGLNRRNKLLFELFLNFSKNSWKLSVKLLINFIQGSRSNKCLHLKLSST